MTQELSDLVNGSGFAFQLGIEHAIRQNAGEHGWRVVSREHPWARGDAQGFIDIVIAKGRAIGVIECKRTRQAKWVFLVPDDEAGKYLGTRALWVAGQGPNLFAGWDMIMHTPSAEAATFCAIRGSGENDRPLLERLGSMLLSSVDALADEEVSILRKRLKERPWYGFYLPIIVTTADLHVCRFNPKNVDLVSGTIDTSAFEEVPYIRFQKGFSTTPPPGFNPPNLQDAAVAHERAVWVVRARDLVSFLKKIREDRFADPPPWEEPLRSLSR